MASIQLGGLATGLDSAALVAQLMAVERQPVTALATQKLKLQAVSTAFQDLNGKLGALKARADALAVPEKFFARSVSSSDATVAGATAGPGSGRGTYSLTVTALARGSIAAAANTTAALTDVVAAAPGSFEFRLAGGGAVVSVPVDATTTLSQLAAAINDVGAGVKASVVNVGTVAAPAYKLTLTSTSTGAASDIAIVHDGTTLGIANTQAAQDAAFSILGVGSFTRASNSFSDVLDGVAITLKSAGTTELALALDPNAVQANIQAMLDAYNDVVRTITGQAQISTGPDGRPQLGAFTGDVVPQVIRRGLAAAVATPLAGRFGSLARIGITTQKDGTLSLDAPALQQALAQDPEAVSDLVAGAAGRDGIADLLSSKLQAMTRSGVGTIATRQAALTAQITDTTRHIDAMQDRLDATEQMLRARFTNLELLVSRLQSTGSALLGQLAGLQAKFQSPTQ